MAYHGENNKEVIPSRRPVDEEPDVQPKEGAYPRADLKSESGVRSGRQPAGEWLKREAHDEGNGECQEGRPVIEKRSCLVPFRGRRRRRRARLPGQKQHLSIQSSTLEEENIENGRKDEKRRWAKVIYCMSGVVEENAGKGDGLARMSPPQPVRVGVGEPSAFHGSLLHAPCTCSNLRVVDTRMGWAFL